MTLFRDEPFDRRFRVMGDLAEDVFERVARHHLGRGFVRYGLNRPPISMRTLPARVRYTPDYLMSDRFVEVQGFGGDRLFKLKLDKWMALHHWNAILPVEFFVYDSSQKVWQMLALHAIDTIAARGKGGLDTFTEGKVYLGIAADVLPDGWEAVPDEPT